MEENKKVEIEVNEEHQEITEEKKTDELDKINDKFLRVSAEYQNYRKRTEKEKLDIYKYANEKFIQDLLPFMDDLDRAMLAIDKTEEVKSIKDGVNIIKKSFEDFLKKEGVTLIKADGETFNPEFHHAVLTEESEKDEGTILEELQKGYMLKDKVIRPTMVKVSKGE